MMSTAQETTSSWSSLRSISAPMRPNSTGSMTAHKPENTSSTGLCKDKELYCTSEHREVAYTVTAKDSNNVPADDTKQTLSYFPSTAPRYSTCASQQTYVLTDLYKLASISLTCLYSLSDVGFIFVRLFPMWIHLGGVDCILLWGLGPCHLHSSF